MMAATDGPMAAGGTPSGAGIARARVPRVALAAGYLGANWLFGGRAGVVLAVLVVAAWLIGVPRGAFWAASVVTMAAAPVALIAQGLPRTKVVGAGFGTAHMAAHVLVGVSLSLAAFAVLWEIVEARTGSGGVVRGRSSGAAAAGNGAESPRSDGSSRARDGKAPDEPPA